MAKFKLFLLTPDIESNSFFSTPLTDFKGQMTNYQKNKEREDMWNWSSQEHSEQNNNRTFNETLSIHTNSQKQLSFDMSARVMINNEWKTNIFVSNIHVGSLLLLEDKHNNHHVFVVKEVKTKLSDINTTYSYSCQDAFSYMLTRQNEGYSIENDPSSKSFIGAKSIDWWTHKIVSECYIPDIYLNTTDCLFKNYYGDFIITQSPESIGDSVEIYKTQDLNISAETFSFSCSDSNALNALLSLGELIGYSIVVKEIVTFKASRVFLTRYFWFESSKVDTVSPYYYSPKKNIENFSFDQSGDSLTTVLNVLSHNLGDETLTLLPTITPAFLEWFQSDEWNKTIYSEGFFINHLDGTIWTTAGDNPTLESVIELEGEIPSSQKAFINEDGNIWIPIKSKNQGDWKLGYWDLKFQFSSNARLSYFYIQEGEGESGVYSNKSFPCWLVMRLQTDKEYTIIHEHEVIPQKFRGQAVEAFLVLQNIFQDDIMLKFYSAAEINIYSYQDITEEDRQFAVLADKIPWLENKIVDFKYFVNKGVLTDREYQLIMSDIFNKLRIVNGKILCYASQYYKALQEKTKVLATLETSVETLHAELEAEGIIPFSESGASKDLKNFINKNSELTSLYSNQTLLYDARTIQNDYFNKFFKAEQRFLKNIYNFTRYFETISSSLEQKGYEYTFTLNKPTENKNYITFSPVNFERVYNNKAVHDRLTFYKKTDGQYYPIKVVTQHNFTQFYIQRAAETSYTLVSSQKHTLYNKNSKYFLKTNTTNTSFVQDVLKNIEPVSIGSGASKTEYYPLNETQLKQYYFFKLYKSSLSSVKNSISRKTEIGYVALPAGSNYALDSVYLSKTWCTTSSSTKDWGFPDGEYHPITYINPNTEDFYGYHEKTSGAVYPCPYADQNPFEFLMDVDPGLYLEKGYNANFNHYKSATDLLTSKSLRYSDSNCTYENYFKYRVATSSHINTEGDGYTNNIQLFTKNIRYVPVCINSSESTPKTFTLDSNYTYVIAACVDGQDKLACDADFKPFALTKSEVLVQQGYSVYKYVDFGEEKLSDVNNSSISDFYKASVFFYNGAVFNPLSDVVENNSIKYFFLDVCNDLYVVESSDISYSSATKYNETEETYFEKLSDGSYVVAPTFHNILTDTSIYIIGGQTTRVFEWNGLEVGEKEIPLKVYLNLEASGGTTTIEYPELFILKYNIKESDIPINTSTAKRQTTQTIKIKYANQVYESTLECSIALKEKIPANLTNGQYWSIYSKEDKDFPLCQEKALMIEQQLTEYWTQAYTASKYCHWFIPEHWAAQNALKENKFFSKLFSGSGSNLKILNTFIPVVGVVSTGSNNKLPSYQITYDPNHSYPDAGPLASEIEYSNMAFRQLASELLGSESNLNQIRLESTSATTTYFYVSSGGCPWKKILNHIGQTQTEISSFSGLYGMLFHLSKNFVHNSLLYYENLLIEKESIWKELHQKYPNIFYEGVFEYPEATTSEELYQMAYYAFKGKSEPEINYSITVLDIYSLKGYSGEELKIGYPILVDVTEYQLDNLAAKKAIDQYLFITDISYKLRTDVNINITVNSVKYDDKLIQKLVKLIR